MFYAHPIFVPVITSAYDYISSTFFIKTIGLHLIIINLYVSLWKPY